MHWRVLWGTDHGNERLVRSMDQWREESGQMTVELCIVFPVVIVVAIIAVNALLFFADCAQLDRIARNAITTLASSPPLDEDPAALAAKVEALVREEMDAQDIACQYEESSGVGRFRVTASFEATLFGRGMRSSLFGISLPKLQHSTALAVDIYSPRKRISGEG